MSDIDYKDIIAKAAAKAREENAAKGITVPVNKAAELEKQGWRVWLTTLFPFWFDDEFSADHIKYWELRWGVFHKIRRKESVADHELVALLILGRGLGKSSTIEAARIMKGALLGGGYSLMISETEDQAQEHLGNCRFLIENPDSKLLEYYPEMAIADNATAMKGMPTADRREMFICQNGWILKAKGLAAKMRGLRVGNQRPDDISLDDIDDVNDSLAVSLNKLRLITASILPVLPRGEGTVDVGQNLIGDHSVVNLILTGKTDALTERTEIGPSSAFTVLDIESNVDDTGKLRHKIMPTSIPSWAGLNVQRAQKFLNNSGLETFRAEYQNEFDQFKSGKVVSNYDEKRQIITWSQFQAIYGDRRIPAHWKCDAGLDVGYSEGQYPHYSAWVFVATSAANSALPGKVFVYRSRFFKGTSIDDQADSVKGDMWPDERVQMWKMSHERTGEMMTLNQKHKLPFSKFSHYRPEDGVPQWQHLSRPNRSEPNPFKDDSQVNGEWAIGDCDFFYIVDDDQEHIPRDDKGHSNLRRQIPNWEYVPVKITDSGQTVQKPSKIDEDGCDALKGVLAYFGPVQTPITTEERVMRSIPEHLKEENITSPAQRMSQMIYLEKEFEKIEKKRSESEWEWEGSR